jgi:hypothetical protein
MADLDKTGPKLLPVTLTASGLQAMTGCGYRHRGSNGRPSSRSAASTKQFFMRVGLGRSPSILALAIVAAAECARPLPATLDGDRPDHPEHPGLGHAGQTVPPAKATARPVSTEAVWLTTRSSDRLIALALLHSDSRIYASGPRQVMPETNNRPMMEVLIAR